VSATVDGREEAAASLPAPVAAALSERLAQSDRLAHGVTGAHRSGGGVGPAPASPGPPAASKSSARSASRSRTRSKSSAKGRGFASMSQARQREIAREGGRAAHEQGTAHEFSSAEAREAGQRGGQRVSRDRSHMAEIGRRGGES